ncbi:MAG: trypsin-like peptidase domain-containing protein [Pirellulaceae bacterium]|nr:trypsin-like peptidase domain-containing protein [Pirellulaceae bacterium]
MLKMGIVKLKGADPQFGIYFAVLSEHPAALVCKVASGNPDLVGTAASNAALAWARTTRRDTTRVILRISLYVVLFGTGGAYVQSQEPTSPLSKSATPETINEATPPVGTEPGIKGDLTPAELFRRVSPSVVSVDVYDERNNHISSGSGFFVHRYGLVATNMHVFSRGHSAVVRTGKDLAQSVLGVVAFDQARDLAILEVPRSDSPTLELAVQPPSVGTRVFAIGNPKGLENTISEGLVSGHRQVSEGSFALQTTAPISPGSSGGPLVLADGRVVGVVYSQLIGGQNLNFARPASDLNELLRRCGKPRTLSEVNRLASGAELFPATISDDNQRLVAAGKAFRSGDLRETIRLLAQVPKTQRGAGYWAAMGTVEFRLSNFKGAYQAFDASLQMDSSNTQTLLKYALASLADVNDVPHSSETWDNCLAACKRVSELDPLNAEAYNILGIQQYGTEATGMFKTAVALAPEHLGAHYNLAVHLLSDDHQDAIKHFRRVLELTKNAEDYELISFHLDKGWRNSKGYSKTNSIEVLTWLGLGMAYHDAGDDPAAEQAYRQVLKLEPNNGHAYAGICFIHRGRSGFKDLTAVTYERKAESILGRDWFMSKMFFNWRSPAVIRKSTLAF